MTQKETVGYLKGIDTYKRMGSLDYQYFAEKKIVRDILEEQDIHTLDELCQEIEWRIQEKIEDKYGRHITSQIYFYFNCLDSKFDYYKPSPEAEKAIEIADNLWRKRR